MQTFLQINFKRTKKNEHPLNSFSSAFLYFIAQYLFLHFFQIMCSFSFQLRQKKLNNFFPTFSSSKLILKNDFPSYSLHILLNFLASLIFVFAFYPISLFICTKLILTIILSRYPSYTVFSFGRDQNFLFLKL